jgi:hypothetical protein
MVSGGGLVIGAFAVHQFPFGVEALAAEAVEPFVFAEIDVAGVVDALQDLLHHSHVGRVGGADEVVVGDVQLGATVP